MDFCVGDLEVKPFSIDHDASNPVAYRIQHGRKSVAVATDMGHYDQYIIEHLQGLDAVLLESNHDVNMLQAGPYPYYLKRRILGDHGHLSNENAGRLLCCILHATPAEAEQLGVKDGEIVSVKVDTNGRSLIFGDVVVRVNENYALAMHIDTDESNAAGCGREQYGEIIK